ncbi:MAG: ATP-grasp domain-containing protein [Pseudomonadota bacterium]
MHWILQEFEDTPRLAAALDRLGIRYSMHKVVPFVGDLIPPPEITDPNSVIMFGSYTLWRNAEVHGYRPGVFKLRPFVFEEPWQPFMLNGPDALFLRVEDVPAKLRGEATWFVRPVSDNKEYPGRVTATSEVRDIAEKVMALKEDEIPRGSLRHDTMLMLTRPARIYKEWRLWIVREEIVTYSIYKEGSRIIYRSEIDDDVREFAKRLVNLNPDFAPAYVMDICRAESGLHLLETNCINAAGFYDADLTKLVAAIDSMAIDQSPLR